MGHPEIHISPLSCELFWLSLLAGVLLCRLSQEDVVGPEAASGGITGEAVKEKVGFPP